MQIDVHNHVLGFGSNRERAGGWAREAMMCAGRSQGVLPSHRKPTEKEWEAAGFPADATGIDPQQVIRDHPGFDKIVLLAVSPHRYEDWVWGTTDTEGVTGVEGPPDPVKCNDYIAALVRKYPDSFIGFSSVNPAYDGPEEAVDELERAITELGLSGVKLYPSYQHWSVEDSEVAFPVFAKAEELGIPVLVHLGGSTIIDTTMSPPAKLDIVGRTFRDLKVIIGHGGMPWGREALFMLMKHPNFYTELSWWASCLTREDLYRYLRSCKPFFVPLAKILFGTDYPGYSAVELREKFLTVNEEAERLGTEPISKEDMDGIMGDNFARVVDLIE